MKTCRICLDELPLGSFYRSCAAADGHAPICRACTKAKTRAWASSNPERVKEKSRAYYLKTKDIAKARATKWAAENPDRRREIRLASSAKHIEKKRAKSIEYNQRKRAIDLAGCREGYRRAAAIRRAREVGNGGEIPLAHWRALIELFEFGTCLYCGKVEQKLVMDHFVPVSLGGKTEVGNLLPCCFSCNSRKRDCPPQDWVCKTQGDNAFGEICWFLDLTKDALSQRVCS